MAWIITFQARNYKTIQQILYRMNRMCVQAGFGGSLKPRKHEQRLLRNMGVHKVRASLLHCLTLTQSQPSLINGLLLIFPDTRIITT